MIEPTFVNVIPMWDTIWKNHKAYIELQLKILQFTWNSFLNSFLFQGFTELFFIVLNSTLAASKCAPASICRPISFQLTGDVNRRSAPGRLFDLPTNQEEVASRMEKKAGRVTASSLLVGRLKPASQHLSKKKWKIMFVQKIREIEVASHQWHT